MTIIDYILPEDQEKYNAIIERAAEAKANAPKAPRAPRVVTKEQKAKTIEKNIAKLMAKLEALKAEDGETGVAPTDVAN